MGPASEYILSSHLFISICLLSTSFENEDKKRLYVLGSMMVYLATLHPFSIVYVSFIVLYSLLASFLNKKRESLTFILIFFCSLLISLYGLLNEQVGREQVMLHFDGHTHNIKNFLLYKTNNRWLYIQVLLSAFGFLLFNFFKRIRFFIILILTIVLIFCLQKFYLKIPNQRFFYDITESFHHYSYLTPLRVGALILFLNSVLRKKHISKGNLVILSISLLVLLSYNMYEINDKYNAYYNSLKEVVDSHKQKISINDFPSPYYLNAEHGKFIDTDMLYVLRWLFKETIDVVLLDEMGNEYANYKTFDSVKGCAHW